MPVTGRQSAESVLGRYAETCVLSNGATACWKGEVVFELHLCEEALVSEAPGAQRRVLEFC